MRTTLAFALANCCSYSGYVDFITEIPLIKIPGEVTKNGKPRTIPLYHTDMVEVLKFAYQTREPMCPSIFQFRGHRLKNYRSAFERARNLVRLSKLLPPSPAALDLFMWLSYRCFTAKGQERVPIFGDFGLANQLGSADYARPRKFRERLERWLDLVRTLWPSCPARITSDGDHMLVQPAIGLAEKGA